MDLIKELETLKPDIKQEVNNKMADQLKMAEAVEKTLQDIGVKLESKFEISLASRLGYRAPS